MILINAILITSNINFYWSIKYLNQRAIFFSSFRSLCLNDRFFIFYHYFVYACIF